MRDLLLLLTLFLASPAMAVNCEVAFTPDKQAVETHILPIIDEAKRHLRMHAYALTNDQIVASLIAAKERGVDVQVLVDKFSITVKGTDVDRLLKANITIYISGGSRMGHSKYIVADKRVLQTGSFNYSAGAEYNSENLVICRSTKLSAQYLEDWESKRAKSRLYE